MGSMFTKNSPGLVVWKTQRAERGRNRESHRRLPGGASSEPTQATVNAHPVEVNVCQITQNKNEGHMMVPSDGMEPQKTSPDGVETQSFLPASGSAKVASGILVAETAVKVADPIGDITVRTEVQPTGLDLQCEDEVTSQAHQMQVVGQDFGGSSDTSKEISAPESPLPSSMVSEEDIPPEVAPVASPDVQEGAARQAMEDAHPPLNTPGEDEPAANDQKASYETDLELGPEKTVGAAEHDTIVQRQINNMSSGETREMAGAHPSLASAETSDGPG